MRCSRPLLVALTLAGCVASRETAGSQALFVARDYVADHVFTAGIEGPATGPDGALYVVNFGREGTIGRVISSPDGAGRAALFAVLPPGSIGNGIRFARGGRMLVADYTGHRILAVSPGDGRVSSFAALPGAYQPNDLALAADGTIYASDPDWSAGTGRIWRITPDGRATVLERGMGTTNGIEVAPDGRHLYVNESVQRRVWVYDLSPAGDIANKRLLIAFADHGLDGMRCDEAGNLYIARHGAGRVAVVSPGGALLREVVLKGSKPSNVAFGGLDGRDVYVTLQDRGAIETFRADRRGREPGGAARR